MLSTMLSALGRVPFPGRNTALSHLGRAVTSLQAWPVPISEQSTLHVDFRDSGAPDLFFRRHPPHEVGLRKVLESMFQPHDCFWDVGANYGYYATLFSEPRYALDAVHAFEPNPRMTALIKRSVGDRPVTVHECALGSESARLALFEPKSRGLLGSVYGSFRPMDNASTTEVAVRTMDEVISGGALAPDVMKIDVEGWEWHVLSGFSALRKTRPVIALEHIDSMAQEAGYSLDGLTAMLRDWRMYRIENDGTLRRRDLRHAHSGNDLLFVHEESPRRELADRLVV